MITFEELTKPVSGWVLERVENRLPATTRGYWVVSLRRDDSTIIEADDRSFERAFESVRRAAENYDGVREPKVGVA